MRAPWSVLLFLFACEATDPCRVPPAPIAVTFLGGAYGKGEVALSKVDGDEITGAIRLTRAEGQPAGDGPLLDLGGTGECRDGVVRIDLGGGSTADGTMRVLGGTLTVVLAQSGFIDAPFGTWAAEIQSSEWKEARRLEGPWIATRVDRSLAAR